MKKYSACTSILVGKKASLDGSVMIGRNEDAKAAWPKHVKIHSRDDLGSHFKSKDNKFEIDLPSNSAKYTATPEWTDKFGLFEEDGINEFGVAMSATESAYSNNNVLIADPLVPDGLNEEAMVTVVLPYIKTAREGVTRLGEIIKQFGTNESNGILFADNDEAWYMETGGGHYWVAQRIPDDGYAVVANQLSIQDIDFNDDANFMYHDGIQKFVAEFKLNPKPGTFNFRNIFGTHDRSDAVYNAPRVWYGHQMFNGNTVDDPESMDLPFIMHADSLISLADVKRYLSSHYNGTEFDPIGTGPVQLKKKYRPISLAKTQESHVLQMRPNQHNIHWLSMGVSAQSIYIPIFAETKDVPRAYKTGGQVYSSLSAYWIFKLTGVLVDAHLKDFIPILEDTQKRLDISFGKQIKNIDHQISDVKNDKVAEFLTDQTKKMSLEALSAFRELNAVMITKSTDMSLLNFNTDENL